MRIPKGNNSHVMWKRVMVPVRCINPHPDLSTDEI